MTLTEISTTNVVNKEKGIEFERTLTIEIGHSILRSMKCVLLAENLNCLAKRIRLTVRFY